MAPSDVLLSDGSTVHVRQITPEDADRILALHARFSDRTRYLRYFSPYPRIPPRDLARFVNVDHRDREALVFAIDVGQILHLGRIPRRYCNSVSILEQMLRQLSAETRRATRYEPNLFIAHASNLHLELNRRRRRRALFH